MKRREHSSGEAQNFFPGLGGDEFLSAESLFSAPSDVGQEFGLSPGFGERTGTLEYDSGGASRVVPDVARMVASFFFGAVGLACGMLIYSRSALPDVIKIGVVAAATGGMTLLGAMFPFLPGSSLRAGVRASILCVLVTTIALFSSGCFFQFLYNLGGSATVSRVDDYVFVIDDSGSMSVTDPMGKRLSALQYFLGHLDSSKRAGLVRFSSEITGTVPLGELDTDQIDRIRDAGGGLMSDGGTDIELGIRAALDMKGVCDPDRQALVVLLTDGESNAAIHTENLARICASGNVWISAVGLNDQLDVNTLHELADRTGGAFYRVDELDDLIDVYSRINVVDTSRDLIGIRTGKAHGSVLYAVLHVFFWVLLGAMVGFGAFLIFQNGERAALIPISSALGGLFVGFLLEVGSLLWWESLAGKSLSLIPLCLMPLFCLRYEAREQQVSDIGGILGENRFTFGDSKTGTLNETLISQDYNELR